MIALIGGSGFQSIALPECDSTVQAMTIETPFGSPSAPIERIGVGGNEVFFLRRHGVSNSIPPHRINYRANLWALKCMGVRDVVSIASVGGISSFCAPGQLVVPHQIIDYTWGRDNTFQSEGMPVVHVDFTHPFSEDLRSRILRSMEYCGESGVANAVYAATQGPRLESAAEINRIERDGGDIVGMTGMPEAALARELGVNYAILALVVNAAAGRGTFDVPILMEEIFRLSLSAKPRIEQILMRLVMT